MGVIKPISRNSSTDPMPTDSAARQLSLFGELELLGANRCAIIHTSDTHSSIPFCVTNDTQEAPLGGGFSCDNPEGKKKMPPRSPLSQGDRDLLEFMLDNNYSYRSMARRFNCCSDTIKRILMREELATFEGAKYQQQRQVETWQRPCMKCKSTAPRPKWQYVCTDCKSPENSGVPDEFMKY